MPFLRNSWYVIAWSGEVGAKPLGRRILDEHVVLYRTENGDSVALSGVCPHRFAPLALGAVVLDRIECPYHGLQFNRTGACVLNPQGSGATPAALALKSYPLIERYGALWIWMGHAELADAAIVPAFDFLDDADRFTVVRGYMHSEANYELLTDNIMDLGHADFLHGTSLGSPTRATSLAKMTTRRDGDVVQCDRWMPEDVQGPLLNWLFDRDGKVDAWLDVRWHPPGLMSLTFGMTDVGAPREAGREIPNVHFLTPETDTSTHYFWANARDFKRNDEALDQQLYEGITAAFTTEDKPMIEAQQKMMGTTDLWSLKPALLGTDAAPVMARRVLDALIANEQAIDARDSRVVSR